MNRLAGQVALVTGGAAGMGAAHCRALAGDGARVAVCDIDANAGAALADEIGGRFYRLDVTAEAEWCSVLEQIDSDMGKVGVLVNNAGIACINPVQDTPTAEWNAVMAVNVNGVFLGTREVVPHMKALGGGVIVNVSSAGGMRGELHMASYVTSKWAVRGLTKAAALDLAPFNIRVLSLHPALVRTPMSSKIDLAAATVSYPIPRPGEAEELARMMLFMVTEATYSTGCEFIADGGTLA